MDHLVLLMQLLFQLIDCSASVGIVCILSVGARLLDCVVCVVLLHDLVKFAHCRVSIQRDLFSQLIDHLRV